MKEKIYLFKKDMNDKFECEDEKIFDGDNFSNNINTHDTVEWAKDCQHITWIIIHFGKIGSETAFINKIKETKANLNNSKIKIIPISAGASVKQCPLAVGLYEFLNSANLTKENLLIELKRLENKWQKLRLNEDEKPEKIKFIYNLFPLEFYCNQHCGSLEIDQIAYFQEIASEYSGEEAFKLKSIIEVYPKNGEGITNWRKKFLEEFKELKKPFS